MGTKGGPRGKPEISSGGGNAHASTRTVGLISVNKPARRGFARGRLLALTWIEYAVLDLLVEEAGRIVRYARFRAAIWRGIHVGPATLRVHTCRLRGKLGDPAKYQLRTIRGVGYMLTSLPNASSSRRRTAAKKPQRGGRRSRRKR